MSYFVFGILYSDEKFYFTRKKLTEQGLDDTKDVLIRNLPC